MKIPDKDVLADVIFSGLWDGPAGYAEINRYIMAGIEGYGIPVCLRAHQNPYTTKMRMSPEEAEFFAALQARQPKRFATFLNSTIPHGFIQSEKRHRIGLTMFESWDTIPELFVDFCNKQHEIWLPSTMCMRVFEAGGVKRPLFYMPLGVDTERFQPLPRVAQHSLLAGVPQSFRIGCSVGHSYRKGYDVLLRAYYSAFTSSDDICLIYKGYWGGSDAPIAKAHVMKDLREVKDEFKGRSDLPAVMVLADCLDADEMASFYAGLNVLCTMSRGEGFFMPGIEAMACEVPNIVPELGAYRDFMDEQTTLFVYVLGTPVADGRIEELCHLYQGLRFVEPSHEDCAVKMRWAYEHPGDLLLMGKKARKAVAANWTWEKATRTMAARLNVIGRTVQ